MKKILMITLSLSVWGILAAPDYSEPLYHLVPLKSKKGRDRFIPIKVYDEPSENGKIIGEVEHDTRNPYSLVTSFPEGKEPYSYHVVTSSQKVGNFYKVYFKKEYAWVDGRDFEKVLDFKEYFKQLEDSIYKGFREEIQLYKEIGGERLPWSTVSKHQAGTVSEIEFPIVETKQIDNKIWIRVGFGKSMGSDGDFTLENPIYFWIRAYKDNGKVNNWYYSSKYYFRVGP